MQTILDYFNKQVKLSSQKTAVVFDGHRNTYAELDQQSNQLANYLVSKGYTNVPVGIFQDRSEKIIISILAILKANCSYVFIDPSYPTERVKYILEKSTIQKVLINTNVSLPKEIAFIDLTENKASINEHPTTAPEVKVEPDSIAYIMFTSGSTGNPKGVVMTHKNVIAYIDAIQDVFNINSSFNCLHTASFSFSSSIRQYLLPLFAGATLHIAHSEVTQSVVSLLTYIKNKNINYCDSVQSLWKFGLPLLDKLAPNEVSNLLDNHLELLVYSGDILPGFLASRLRDKYKLTHRIINLYGQTETLGGIYFEVPLSFVKDTGAVQIGKSLKHQKAYLFDEISHKEVPLNKPGEIYIDSASVAQGYFNDETLTKNNFIKHIIKGKTLFKTGDIAKINSNEEFEILGRNDFQVKIRGIRIETAEIETVLNKHFAIGDSIVLPLKDSEGNTTLCAYLVLTGNLTIYNLQEYLNAHLSKVMIPDVFRVIDSIPLTPNKKIDRKKLPEVNHRPLEMNIVEPQSENEKLICNLFKEILGLDKFSIIDNFFDFGGHSLLAAQLVVKLENTFNKALPLNIIYKYSTPSQLAGFIEKNDSVISNKNLVLIQDGDKNYTPFYLIHGDDGNYKLPKLLNDKIPFYAFFHQGQDGSHLKYTTIKSIAKNYIDQLIPTLTNNKLTLGGFSLGGLIAYEMAQQLKLEGFEITTLFLLDTRSPDYKGKILQGNFPYDWQKQCFYKDTFTQGDKSSFSLKKWRKRFYRYAQNYIHPPLIKLNLLFGKKMPLALRNKYIMEIYRESASAYKPDRYDGDVVLFRATLFNWDSINLGWQKHLKQSLEIHQLYSVMHLEIFTLPEIQKIADRINQLYAE